MPRYSPAVCAPGTCTYVYMSRQESQGKGMCWYSHTSTHPYTLISGASCLDRDPLLLREHIPRGPRPEIASQTHVLLWNAHRCQFPTWHPLSRCLKLVFELRMNLPDLASHLPGPRDKKHVPAFASWLGRPPKTCLWSWNSVKCTGFSGRQSPFWAPESPACRATGTGPPPPPRATHTLMHTHTPSRPRPGPRRGGLRAASGGRTEGSRIAGHYCGCSYFHTVLLGPLLPALSHLPELSSPLVPTIQQYSTSIKLTARWASCNNY